MNAFQRLLSMAQIVASLYPVLIGLIDNIEAALPGSGKGKEKLETIKSTLEAVWSTATDLGIAFGDAWPALEKAIAAIVSFRNMTGIFRRSTPAAAPAMPSAPPQA